MGVGRRVLRAFFGVVIFWGVIWFLYVGILANQATTRKSRITVPSTRTFKHLNLIGRNSHPIHQDSDLNYVSKRKVPNGPDPIHNRYIIPLLKSVLVCLIILVMELLRT